MMKIAVFSAERYDRKFLDAANVAEGHQLKYFDTPLSVETASLATGHEAVCIFVNDTADAAVLDALQRGGTRLVALRIQQRRPSRGSAPGHQGRARRRLFALLGCRARRRAAAGH
jgi:hypothetical protein